MSIAIAIQNAQQKVANAYTAVNAKGGTLPATQDLSNLPTAIDSISTGDVWHNWKTDAVFNNNDITFPENTENNYYSSIVYGNGTFVLADSSSNGNIFYSTNGTTWTKATNLPITANWCYKKGLTFGNGLFIVTGYDGTNTRFMYSSDGINWTASTTNVSSYHEYTLAYGNGKFIGLDSGSGTSNCFVSSTDGDTWTAYDVTNGRFYTGLAFGNGVFISSYNNQAKIVISSDGVNWTEYTRPQIFDSWNLARFSFAGTGFFAFNNYASSTLGYSEDGENWTQVTLPSSEYYGNVLYSNGIYIAVGQYINIYYSTDLEHWTILQIADTTYRLSGTAGTDSNGKVICAKMTSTSTSNKGSLVNIAQSECYTLDATPTTSTQVYEIPKKTSALTITTVGTGTITLSDTKVYNRNSAGDVQSPVLGTKTIDTNGTYTAASDYLDGFSEVTVDLQEIGIPLEISSGVLQPKSSSFEIDWPDVTSINCGNFGLTNAFSNSAITKFSLPNLILSTTQANNLLQCCKGCTSLTTVDLSSLQESKGTGGLSYAFYGCTNLTSVNMQNLETIEGYNVFNYTFYNTGLTSFRFQKLKSISHGSGFLNTVMDCSFGGTTPITSLYFDVLETVARQENLQNMLSGVTGCTVHFPAALQSTIGSWTSVTNGFGGTNTTVLFDL